MDLLLVSNIGDSCINQIAACNAFDWCQLAVDTVTDEFILFQNICPTRLAALYRRHCDSYPPPYLQLPNC